MCRWLPYSGSPLLLERLLYTPVHSLIYRSLHSQLGAETTNDGATASSSLAGTSSTHSNR